MTNPNRPDPAEAMRESLAYAEERIAQSPERLREEIARLQKVLAAARCIRHWHDTGRNGEGMVVSSEHVRKLWDVIGDYDAPYLPHGQCSRHAEGCQGGIGESVPPADAPSESQEPTGRTQPYTDSTRRTLRTSTCLTNFVMYCTSYPDQRFWQALRNWSGASEITYRDKDGSQHNTFYWENCDGPKGASNPPPPNWQEVVCPDCSRPTRINSGCCKHCGERLPDETKPPLERLDFGKLADAHANMDASPGYLKAAESTYPEMGERFRCPQCGSAHFGSSAINGDFRRLERHRREFIGARSELTRARESEEAEKKCAADWERVYHRESEEFAAEVTRLKESEEALIAAGAAGKEQYDREKERSERFKAQWQGAFDAARRKCLRAEKAKAEMEQWREAAKTYQAESDGFREQARKQGELAKQLHAELSALKVEVIAIIEREAYLPKFPDGDEGGCIGCETGWCQSAVDIVCDVRNRTIAALHARLTSGDKP